MYQIKVILRPVVAQGGYMISPRQVITETVNTPDGVMEFLKRKDIESVVSIITELGKDITDEFTKQIGSSS